MSPFRRLAALLVAGALATGAGAATLRTLNSRFFQELDQLAFNGYGDTDYWSKRCKKTAFVSARHMVTFAAAINESRDHGDAGRLQKFKQIRQLNGEFSERANTFAFKGYGDTGYWSKRTKAFATEIAMHCANVVAVSDGKMLAAGRNEIGEMLQVAETAGFNGYGDVDYWSRRAKKLSQDVQEILRRLETDMMEACLP
jgi:hypothetical protein